MHPINPLYLYKLIFPTNLYKVSQYLEENTHIVSITVENSYI